MVDDNRGKDKVVKTRRIVEYTRVSSSTQDLDDSPEEQREAMRVICEREGWNLISMYEDSGSTDVASSK